MHAKKCTVLCTCKCKCKCKCIAFTAKPRQLLAQWFGCNSTVDRTKLEPAAETISLSRTRHVSNPKSQSNTNANWKYLPLGQTESFCDFTTFSLTYLYRSISRCVRLHVVLDFIRRCKLASLCSTIAIRRKLLTTIGSYLKLVLCPSALERALFIHLYTDLLGALCKLHHVTQMATDGYAFVYSRS